jgi:hypothetical protein
MGTCVVIVGYKGSSSEPKHKDDQYRCPYLCAEMPKEGGTTAGASRGAVIVGRKRALGPIGVGDEMQELLVRCYASCLAPHRKHVTC